jgi:hypothetical protein
MAAEENERLRDAFAQLLAMGNDQAVPAEAVWAQQGPRQFPPPQPDLDVRRFPLPEEQGLPNVVTPQRQFNDDERYLRFPMQGDQNRANPAEPPFGGKGLVVGEYKPPDKKDNKNKKKGKR